MFLLIYSRLCIFLKLVCGTNLCFSLCMYVCMCKFVMLRCVYVGMDEFGCGYLIVDSLVVVSLSATNPSFFKDVDA